MEQEDIGWEFEERLRALRPFKWIPLDVARSHVVEWLAGGGRTATDEEWRDAYRDPSASATTEFGLRYTKAQNSGQRFLIRLLRDGELTARGVIQNPGSHDVVMAALDAIWWQRVIDDVRAHSFHFIWGHYYPAHVLNWEQGAIMRCVPDRRPESEREVGGTAVSDFGEVPPNTLVLLTATDIEVDRTKLLEIVKLADGGIESDAATTRRTPGPKPDETRITAIRRLAKEEIPKGHTSVRQFLIAIADRYSEKDPRGIDHKQVGRILFGER